MSGCAGTDAPPPTEVRLTAEGFEPVTLETPAGSEVRFVNRSERPQQLASVALDDGAAAVPPGAAPIDSGRLVAGATYAARLDVPGQYVVESLLAGTGTQAVVTILVEEVP
jgi:plastocyanin